MSRGPLIYNAAVDHRPADCSDIAGGRSYTPAILEQALAGKPVTMLTTRPYRCSVKYPG
jgi:hypothetical protein